MYLMRKLKPGTAKRYQVGAFDPDGLFYSVEAFADIETAMRYVNYCNGGTGRHFEYNLVR